MCTLRGDSYEYAIGEKVPVKHKFKSSNNKIIINKKIDHVTELHG
tara:strand:+ start:24 stop:158 length:135 start_codon:yes stop_codon:yes gene_type:complete